MHRISYRQCTSVPCPDNFDLSFQHLVKCMLSYPPTWVRSDEPVPILWYEPRESSPEQAKATVVARCGPQDAAATERSPHYHPPIGCSRVLSLVWLEFMPCCTRTIIFALTYTFCSRLEFGKSACGLRERRGDIPCIHLE
jgi:hypothetical protein